MNLYNITEQMLIGLAGLAGASNVQFFDIRYALNKISGGQSKYFEYWVINQKELQELFSEIKALTKTKASKKSMMDYIKEEVRKVYSDDYKRNE